ncbi:MAG: hypothetical protein R3A13_05985 [Bdellovibrionota bacterium]
MFRLCLLLLILNSVSCSPLLSYERVVVHKVSYVGENPSMISKWYTASPGNWAKIKTYNTQIQGDNLRLGDQIRIPNTLVNAFRPMPESFVKQELKNYSKASGQAPVSTDKLQDELLQSLVKTQ